MNVIISVGPFVASVPVSFALLSIPVHKVYVSPQERTAAAIVLVVLAGWLAFVGLGS